MRRRGRHASSITPHCPRPSLLIDRLRFTGVGGGELEEGGGWGGAVLVWEGQRAWMLELDDCTSPGK